MKRTLLVAAAFLTLFTACEKPGTTIVVEDAVSITPETSGLVVAKGDDVTVKVTSSSTWALDTEDGVECQWAKPDKKSGENGDVVTFTVDENTDETKVREIVYIFTCGKKTVEYTIVQDKAEERPAIFIETKEVEGSFLSGGFEIPVVLKNLVKDDISVNVLDDATWLHYVMTLEGEETNTAKVVFEYDKNETAEVLTAEFTVSAEGVDPITIVFTQYPESSISVAQSEYRLLPTEGTLEIRVDANFEYEISYSEGADWLQYSKNTEGVESWTYSAIEGGSKREATITFTEKNPFDGIEAKSATVKVIQTTSIISTVAYMKGHFAMLTKWKNPDAGKFGTTISAECLIKHDPDFAGRVETLFGIHDRFLLRLGGKSEDRSIWEICYADKNNKAIIVASNKGIPANEWTHIAVVFDGVKKKITLYQNAEVVGEADMDANIKDIDLTETYSANNFVQRFQISRSWDSNRDFYGHMSEIRIWNKALSLNDIKAPSHFYTVPVDSEGLALYWKLDDGTGAIIKDYANENDVNGFNTYMGGQVVWVKEDVPVAAR